MPLLQIMKSFGGAKLIGPLLIGLDLPIEVAPLDQAHQTFKSCIVGLFF